MFYATIGVAGIALITICIHIILCSLCLMSKNVCSDCFGPRLGSRLSDCCRDCSRIDSKLNCSCLKYDPILGNCYRDCSRLDSKLGSFTRLHSRCGDCFSLDYKTDRVNRCDDSVSNPADTKAMNGGNDARQVNSDGFSDATDVPVVVVD